MDHAIKFFIEFTRFSTLSLLFCKFFALVFIEPAETVNFSLVTVSMTDRGRNGFMLTNPEYDILVEMLKESDPDVFHNFTHYSLRLDNQNLSDKSLIRDSSLALHCADGVANVMEKLAAFYYDHPDIFGRPLAEQFPILSTAGQLLPHVLLFVSSCFQIFSDESS